MAKQISSRRRFIRTVGVLGALGGGASSAAAVSGAQPDGLRVDFARYYGGQFQDPKVTAIVRTPDRGYAIIGNTNANPDQPADNDPFLLKTDQQGRRQFLRTYSYNCRIGALGLTRAHGDGYVIVGHKRRRFWLMNVNDEGTRRFERTYTGPITESVTETPDGGRREVFLYGQHAVDVVRTRDKGYTLAGTIYWYTEEDGDAFWRPARIHRITTNRDGTEQRATTYESERQEEATALVRTDEGGYAVSGTSTPITSRLPPDGPSDLRLVKFTGGGAVEFARRYGGDASETSSDIVEASRGGFALSGTTTSNPDQRASSDYLLLTTSSAGRQRMLRSYGRQADEEATTALTRSHEDGYLLVGYRAREERRRTLVVNADRSGEERWARIYTELDTPADVVRAPGGGYVLAGQRSGRIGVVRLSQ